MGIFTNFDKHMGQKSANFVRNCVLRYQVSKYVTDFRRSPDKYFLEKWSPCRNPFLLSGLFHSYLLDKSISTMCVWCTFSFLFDFLLKFLWTNSVTLIRRRVLWRPIRVCTVCLGHSFTLKIKLSIANNVKVLSMDLRRLQNNKQKSFLSPSTT